MIYITSRKKRQIIFCTKDLAKNILVKEIEKLLRKFAHDVFSSNLNETATLDDLSYEYMKEIFGFDKSERGLSHIVVRTSQISQLEIL